MKKNKISTLLFALFAIIGTGLIVGSILFFLSGMRFRQSAVSITGEIEDIVTSRDSDGDIDHEVYVRYTFDGVDYDMVRLSEYSGSMHVGKSINLLCDPEDPWDVRTESSIYFVFITLMLMGIICFIVGVVPVIVSIVKKQRSKRLLANGRVLYATVESIDLNRNYSVNGRNPYVIYCSWKDEYADTLYRFKSDNLWTDPVSVFPEGSEIEVYVDANDFRKYYVNVEHKMSQKIVDLT